MTHIARREAIVNSIGGVDHSGLLFTREGRIYRALNGATAETIRRLLEERHLGSVFSSGLVDFWLSEHTVEGFELVVECRRISRVTFPHEWPTAMLADAASMVVTLSRVLADLGYGVADPHPWNVVFEGTTPRYIDLGSILPYPNAPRNWEGDFRTHFLNPLLLRNYGLHRLANAVIEEHPTGPLKRVLGSPVGRLSLRGVPLSRRIRRAPDLYYKGLMRKLSGLNSSGETMKWSAYDQKPTAFDDPDSFTIKQQVVNQILLAEQPTTLLDIASNVGWYSELAARQGFDVVAIDVDDSALGRLFRRAKALRLSLLPLRIDVVFPKGSHGVGLCHPGPYERIRSDVVLALALVHHLAHDYGLSFHALARILSALTSRTAIVEFIPSTDDHLTTWRLGEWYTEESFVEAMTAFFPRFDRFESSPAPRSLYVFRRS